MRKPRPELAAGPHPELAIDASEVPLDRLRAHEQAVRYLLVGSPGHGQLGDLALGGSEIARRGGATADPRQLVNGLGRPQRRAELLEDGRCLFQRVARGPLVAGPALHAPEGEQRAGQLEWLTHPVVKPDGALELGDAVIELAR